MAALTALRHSNQRILSARNRKKPPMAVSKRLRYEVLRRDNHTCRYCGATAPDVPLRVDHVTPVALGGTDTPDNLVTACEPCNSGKSSTIEGFVAAVSARAVPPSPEGVADEVERLWVDAYTAQHGPSQLTLQMLDEVRSSARDMYRVGLPYEQLKRAATTSGLKAETFVGLGDTSDAEWLALTAEAFRVWRSLWHRSSRHTSWPSMDDIFFFETSVEEAANDGFDRFSVLRAAARAGHEQRSIITAFLESTAQQGGDC